MQCPIVQQNCIVTINRDGFTIVRMNDEHTHHAVGHLRHFIGVWVVHVRAVLPQRELVNKSFAWFDVRLRQSANAVHATR